MSDRDQIELLDDVQAKLWDGGCQIRLTYVPASKVDIVARTHPEADRAKKLVHGHGFGVRKVIIGDPK